MLPPLDLPDFDAGPTMMNGNAVDRKMSPQIKAVDVRISSIVAARVVAGALRPSLGNRGEEEGKSRNCNGATRLSKLNIQHPAGKMLVDASKKQYVRAGNGTSSTVIIAGALLEATGRLMSKGISVSAITASFRDASERSAKILEDMSRRVEDDRNVLIELAGSKVASGQECKVLTRVAVDSILDLLRQQNRNHDIDLDDIRMVRQLGKNVSETKLESGVILAREERSTAMPNTGPAEVKNAQIALIDYWIVGSNGGAGVEAFDERSKEQMLKEERKRLLDDCKQIKKLGASVVLILKSDMDEGTGQIDVNLQICLHFLAKMDIMAVPHVYMDDVEGITQALGCKLVGHPDSIAPNKLGSADYVAADKDQIKFSGLRKPTSTVVLRGPSDMILDDAERAIREVQSFLWILTQRPFLTAGGGAAETEVALRLKQYAQTIGGVRSECVKAFADALEIIPYTLAENAGMDPVATVMDLRRKHAHGTKEDVKLNGMCGAGVAMREGIVTDMYTTSEVQPLLVPMNAIELATETVSKILRVDHFDGN